MRLVRAYEASLPAESWWRSTILLARLARPRLVDRPLWRLRYRHGIPILTPRSWAHVSAFGSAVERRGPVSRALWGIAGKRLRFALPSRYD